MMALLAGAAYLALWYLMEGEITRDPLAGTFFLPLFGDTRLWVASMLLALPLALWMGSVQRVETRWGRLIALGAVGLLAPWVLLGAWETIGPLVSFTGADQLIRWIARPLVALMLVLPWAVMAALKMPKETPSWSTGFGFLLVATIPSAFYGVSLAQSQQIKFRAQMERDLVVPSLESIYILGQLEGWDGESGKKRNLEKLNLSQVKKELSRIVARSGSARNNAKEQWELAIAWVRLGQSQRAKNILDELGLADPMASLFAASLDRFDGHWPEAESRYSQLMEMPQGTWKGEDRFALFEGRAEALQGLGRFEELSVIWEKALVEFPVKAGSIRFNQAMAEASRGRFGLALNYLSEAENRSGDLKAQVEKQRRRILANTPACFIKPN